MISKIKNFFAARKRKSEEEYHALHIESEEKIIDYGDTIYIEPKLPFFIKINKLLTGGFYKKGWVNINKKIPDSAVVGGVNEQNKA